MFGQNITRSISAMLKVPDGTLAGNGLNHWRNVPTSTWSEAHGHLSS